MKLYINSTQFIDTTKGIDLSIPVSDSNIATRAWNAPRPKITPVETDNFIGSVSAGASVNFNTITCTPHGNSTHTECLGHITEELFSINKTLEDYFFDALLISVTPQILPNNDHVITAKQLQAVTQNNVCQAIIIRTTPNTIEKLNIDYSDSNPPYFEAKCVEVLNKMGVNHLLVDLPSVDKEYDDGLLAMHRAFWDVPTAPQYHKTITELIFVPNTTPDGRYILNLQVAPIENDAAPSRPVIYPLYNIE